MVGRLEQRIHKEARLEKIRMTDAQKTRIKFILMVSFIGVVLILMWRSDQDFQKASQLIAMEYPAPQLGESFEDSIVKIDYPFDQYVSHNNNLPNQIYAQLYHKGKRAIFVYVIREHPMLREVLVPGSKLSKEKASDSISVFTAKKEMYRYRLYGVDGHPLK
jgi:hypothetical protein